MDTRSGYATDDIIVYLYKYLDRVANYGITWVGPFLQVLVLLHDNLQTADPVFPDSPLS